MINISLLILLGISGFIGGIIAGVLGLQQAGNDQLPWLIAVSLLLFGIGAYSFFRASRHGEKNGDEPIKIKGSGENVLVKNTQILMDYAKSSEKRDKMKMLKMVAAAEEQMKEQGAADS